MYAEYSLNKRRAVLLWGYSLIFDKQQKWYYRLP